jgi:hypothetical protein
MGFIESTAELVGTYLPQELHIPAYFCGFNILWTYVAAELTGNASQVDRVGLCLLLPRFMYSPRWPGMGVVASDLQHLLCRVAVPAFYPRS